MPPVGGGLSRARHQAASAASAPRGGASLYRAAGVGAAWRQNSKSPSPGRASRRRNLEKIMNLVSTTAPRRATPRRRTFPHCGTNEDDVDGRTGGGCLGGPRLASARRSHATIVDSFSRWTGGFRQTETEGPRGQLPSHHNYPGENTLWPHATRTEALR